MGFINEVIKPFLTGEKPKELSSEVQPENVLNNLNNDYYHTF